MRHLRTKSLIARAMDKLLDELREVLERENNLWKDHYFPLTWKIFINKDNIHVNVQMLESDVLRETIYNTDDLKEKVSDYLEYLRNH